MSFFLPRGFTSWVPNFQNNPSESFLKISQTNTALSWIHYDYQKFYQTAISYSHWLKFDIYFVFPHGFVSPVWKLGNEP